MMLESALAAARFGVGGADAAAAATIGGATVFH